MSSRDRLSRKKSKYDDEDRHHRYVPNFDSDSSRYKDGKSKKHRKEKHKKDKKKRSSSNHKSKKHRHKRKHSHDSAGSYSSSSIDSGKEKKREKKEKRKDSEADESKAKVPTVPNLANQPADLNNGRLTVKDFPYYKKKVVVSNLPTNASQDEIFTFFNTYINTLRALTQTENDADKDEKDESGVMHTTASIDNIEIREGIFRFGVIQINNRDDLDH